MALATHQGGQSAACRDGQHTDPSSHLSVLADLLTVTSRSGPTQPMAELLCGLASRLARCWNPTAWCAACRDGCCGIDTIGYLRPMALSPVDQSRTARWAGVVAVGLSRFGPLGLIPIGLSPSSPRRGRSVNTLSHKRCLSLGALYTNRRNLMRLCACTHSKIIKNCPPHRINYKRKVFDDRKKY